MECGLERPIRKADQVRSRSQEPPTTRANWRKQARKSPN